MTRVVVVCTGGGGGGAACVVVVCTGGGGGGAACVVVVGAGVVLATVGTTVACTFWADGLAWWCFLALCAGFALAAVVVVVAAVGVDCVVEVLVVAAARWLDVDEEAPHALTTKMSNEAANAMRSCFMADSLTPRIWWLTWKDAPHPGLLPGRSGSVAARYPTGPGADFPGI